MNAALVIDDDLGSCLVLKKMITSLGLQCDFANNVSDGLRAAASRKYRFLFLDCVLPDHHHSVAVHAFKLLSGDDYSIAVIGIVSYPDKQMEIKLKNSGIIGVLAKPISKADLAEALRIAAEHVTPISQPIDVPQFNTSYDVLSSDRSLAWPPHGPDLPSSSRLQSSDYLDPQFKPQGAGSGSDRSKVISTPQGKQQNIAASLVSATGLSGQLGGVVLRTPGRGLGPGQSGANLLPLTPS